MFTLMRNLRRNLINNNLVGKYFLYAFGEFILIVLGILVALWIDNWNQERQELKREQFYLSGLKEEFQVSLQKLDTLIVVNRKSYVTAQDLLRLIPQSSSLEEESQVSQMLIQAFSYDIAYNPNNSLLEELMNSGRLETLSDRGLRQHLTSWESFVRSVQHQENSLRIQRDQTSDLLLAEEGSIRTILVRSGVDTGGLDLETSGELHSNLPLLKSREFENNLLLFILTATNIETVHYAPLKRKIETILELIEAGLE